MDRFRLRITESSSHFENGDISDYVYYNDDLEILHKIKDIYLERFFKGLAEGEEINIDIYDNNKANFIYEVVIDKTFFDLLINKNNGV